MIFKNILNDLAKSEPQDFDQVSSRRNVLKSLGAKVAAVAVPFAVAASANKAQAKTTDSIVDALNSILELEYMLYNLYHRANNTGNLIPPSSFSSNNDQPGFKTIEAQKREHIILLNSTITTVGGTPFTPTGYDSTLTNPLFIPSAYDFTATKDSTYGPIFHTVFSSYPIFLMLSQVLEDTAVHNYQGELYALGGNTTVLTQTFQMMTATARHAAHVRLLRRLPDINSPESPAPWINNNIPPALPLQPYYTGEDNVTQRGINITTLTGVNGNIPKVSATAAFDEPFDQPVVAALIEPYKLY
jgi:hypothetical protein